MAKSKGISTGAAVGAGTAAAAAVAGAAAYWFYGADRAAKHRKTAASWMNKARKEAVSAIETAVKEAGDIDKDTYASIAGGILERYSNMSGATAFEVKEMTREMKEAWNHMQKARRGRLAKEVKKVVKKVKKTVKKVVKKARS